MNIHIILKESSQEGFNGTITTFLGYGLGEKWGGNTNFNYRKNRLHLFSNLSTNINRTNENTTISRRLFIDNQTLETDIFSEDKALFFLDAGSLTTSFWRSVADEDQDEKSPKCAVG